MMGIRNGYICNAYHVMEYMQKQIQATQWLIKCEFLFAAN